jgi:hypothetical protein
MEGADCLLMCACASLPSRAEDPPPAARSPRRPSLSCLLRSCPGGLIGRNVDVQSGSRNLLTEQGHFAVISYHFAAVERSQTEKRIAL